MFFHQVDDVFYPDEIIDQRRDRDMAALVVRTVVGYFFAAWAEAGHRHQYFYGYVELAMIDLAYEGHFVIE